MTDSELYGRDGLAERLPTRMECVVVVVYRTPRVDVLEAALPALAEIQFVPIRPTPWRQHHGELRTRRDGLCKALGFDGRACPLRFDLAESDMPNPSLPRSSLFQTFSATESEGGGISASSSASCSVAIAYGVLVFFITIPVGRISLVTGGMRDEKVGSFASVDSSVGPQ